MFGRWLTRCCAFVAATAAMRSDEFPVKTVTTLDGALRQKTWTDDVGRQRVFVDGQLSYFNELQKPPIDDADNARAASSHMYVALGCKCAETVADALAALNRWTRRYPEAVEATGPYLRGIHETVLKTASALFHLVDLAGAYAWSHEPAGPLSVALSLNLNLNALMAANELRADRHQRIVFEMINLIERFTVPNCGSPDARTPAPGEYEWSASDYEAQVKTLIQNLNVVLDGAGLAVTNSDRYNIAVDPPTRRGEPSAADPHRAPSGRFDIISHVTDALRSVLDKPDLVWDATEDLERVYRYQRMLYDYVLFVIHKYALLHMKEFGKKAVTTTIFTTSSTSDDELIKTYEKLLVNFADKKFPAAIVHYVRLILGLLKDVKSKNKIYDLDCLTRTEKKYVDIFTEYYTVNVFNEKILLVLYKKTACQVHEKFELHLFLEQLASIEFIEYYNDIYNSLRMRFTEPIEPVVTDLDRIHHGTEIENDKSCSASLLDSVYEYCFDIRSSIKETIPDKIQSSLKSNFKKLLTLFEKLAENDKRQNGRKTNGFILTAVRYLKINLYKFPTHGNVKEKLTRIVYLVTNFVDKHVARNCVTLIGRDLYFKEFETCTEKQKKLFGINSYSKLKFFLGDSVNSVRSSLNDHVLFNGFIDNFGHVRIDLRLFWKGDLKSINDIRDDMDKNLFDYSSIPRYVNAVVEWTAAVFSYTLLDIMNYLSMDNVLNEVNEKITKMADKAFKYNLLPPRFCVPFGSIIYELYKSKNWSKNDTDKTGRMYTVLENYLIQYENVVKRESKTYLITTTSLLNFDVDGLVKMNNFLKRMHKTKTTVKSNSSGTTIITEPLQFKLTDYFTVYNVDDKTKEKKND